MTSILKYIEESLESTDYDALEKSTVAGFFVHSSIFDKIQMRTDITIKNVWDYELQIGEMCYSMKLIYVNSDVEGSFKNMFNLCRCDVMFPWEENLTLFVPVKWFPILEKFIDNQGLRFHVLTTEDHQGCITSNEMIRVVRFYTSSDTKKKFITHEFREFLRPHISARYPNSLYCTMAFPWLQPWALQHFDVPLKMDNPIYAVIPIIFDNSKEFSNNLFDLVAARMAFCDCRNLRPTVFAQSAIDRVIVRSLQNSKYYKNSGFDLDQYMFDKNIAIIHNDTLISYFVYVFQQFLGSSVALENNSQRHRNSIVLAEHSDVLNMLNLKSNLRFKIDGQNFSGMSFKLFNDLAGCHNVTEIVLDTNQRLDNNVDGIDHLKFLNTNTDVHFIGCNTHNFIEEFMLCIQKYPIDRHIGMYLFVDCELRSYLMFDNFPIFEIIFRDVNISTRMLTDFSECTKLCPIMFRNCKFECTRENWILFNNLVQLDVAYLQEEDNTWESIFDFVAHILSSSETNEFEFNHKIEINSVSLKDLKFSCDEYGTKVIVQNRFDNEILDLYYVKFGIEPDEKCDYDFYQ